MRKPVGVVLCLVLLFVFGAAGVVLLGSRSRLARTFDVPSRSLLIPADAAAVERGRHLASAVLACTSCHAADFGGAAFFDAQPMGSLPAPNLTSGRGGVGGALTPPDWDRAIRHGVGRDGQGLLWMPSEAYEHLGDEETADVIAFLQSLPPVDRELAPKKLGPVARIVLATGAPVIAAETVDHDAVGRPRSGGEGPHLVRVSGCVACHGDDLTGGKVPGGAPNWPPAANLTPHADGLGGWDEAAFRRALREGRKPDGTTIDPKVMPWESYARMTDAEIAAIWEYLGGLEPREGPAP